MKRRRRIREKVKCSSKLQGGSVVVGWGRDEGRRERRQREVKRRERVREKVKCASWHGGSVVVGWGRKHAEYLVNTVARGQVIFMIPHMA